LTHLDLSKNKIGIHGTNAILSCLTNNNTLKKLNLSENSVNAAPSFYSFKYNHQLNELNLSKTKIGTEGCNGLIEAISQNPSSQLCSIDLRYEGVGDDQVIQQHLTFKISSLLKITKANKAICIIETYPPNEGGVSDGWLSYEGWENFSNLRKILSENIEFRKKVIIHSTHYFQ
jgi:Ran GTPase-activating protein (RanGAP) involved in mRNA processing and transport